MGNWHLKSSSTITITITGPFWSLSMRLQLPSNQLRNRLPGNQLCYQIGPKKLKISTFWKIPNIS